MYINIKFIYIYIHRNRQSNPKQPRSTPTRSVTTALPKTWPITANIPVTPQRKHSSRTSLDALMWLLGSKKSQQDPRFTDPPTGVSNNSIATYLGPLGFGPIQFLDGNDKWRGTSRHQNTCGRTQFIWKLGVAGKKTDFGVPCIQTTSYFEWNEL